MSIRIDRERIRGLLTARVREGNEKPSISGLLYHAPPLRGGNPTSQSTIEFLAGFRPLQDLEKKELSLLASLMHERNFGDGETIFDQGNPSGALYVIRSGCVELSRKIAGKDVTIATLAPNELFGELALLLEEMPRRISAKSRGPSVLLAFSRPDLATLMVRSPFVSMKLFRALARVVALRFTMLMEEIEGSSQE